MNTGIQELLSNFHFLRPAWLVLIPAIAMLVWYLVKRHRAAGWQRYIKPTALHHLSVGNRSGGKLTIACLTLPLFLAAFALAGPSWQLLPENAATNRQAMVYLLDLSPSMLASDVTPNRLTLARLKLADLLEQRTDGESALIVYAGDAYRVAPLTDDPATIKAILPTLDPSIMPTPGSQAEAAIALALTLLSDADHNKGDILMITDGVHLDAIESIKTEIPAGIRLSILGVGSTEGATIPDNNNGVLLDENGNAIVAKLNEAQLKKLAQQTRGHYTPMTADNADIMHLLSLAESPIKSELIQNGLQYDQWHDAGYWLALLLLPFAALMFKKRMLWSVYPLTLSLSLFTLAQPSTSVAADWPNIWLSDDQQAMRLLESGDAASAATRFSNPRWAAVALYRAEQYEQIVESFTPSSAEDFFLLGNAYALLAQNEKAISAYNKALIFSASSVNQLTEDAGYNIALLQNQVAEEQDNNLPENESSSAENRGDENDAGEQSAGETQGDSATQTQVGGAIGGSDSLNQDALQDQGPPGEALNNAESEPIADDATRSSDAPRINNGADEKNQQSNNGETFFEENTNTVLNPYAEQWLRTLPQDPGGYFRRKLSYQSQLREQSQSDTTNPSVSQRY